MVRDRPARLRRSPRTSLHPTEQRRGRRPHAGQPRQVLVRGGSDHGDLGRSPRRTGARGHAERSRIRLRRRTAVTLDDQLSSKASSTRRGDDERARRVELLLLAQAEPLLRYFSRRAPLDDAPDLLSETMLTVWRRAKDVPAGNEGTLWIYGVARRVLATHHRSNRRRTSLVDRLRDQIVVHNPAHDQLDDISAHLHHLIERLPAVDRDIIGLVHWEGFTLEEAARILEKNPSTIRTRYARLRQQLKSELQAEV
ncbi:hypothetical protein C5C36_14065 [Rathayibacter sp. AY1G1]|nr:hypothetical protein C5B98_08465 [Rathayibacter sp. AY1A5]PPF71985.1 hypothetical protein C5C46_08615 [Rathayibacter sp. AY1E6]PPG19003.1 hypothetical protein C5C74_07865 [Rathayibacter sp. AY1E8]PPG36086.1 hypothetical protein C5C30_16635 [Rathayibacter sp. AY2B5]PPG49951.1 hypothetical protein C5C24_11510 [Rathayibacter sp. AY2B3]PPH00153.1 hypothetical protein C5C44_15920 [Rathayibacter sp. AY1F6]PPH10490.1 hypothetical protein C5C36_14065 [Rathayibacter sp. AY1G1]PPH34473.1 hypothetic